MLKVVGVVLAVACAMAGCADVDESLSETSSEAGVTLQSVAVTPAVPVVFIGAQVQMTATGFYNNATTQDLTGSVTWASTVPTVATISPTGLVTALKQGSTSITAKSGTKTGKTTFKVSVTMTSVVVTPDTVTLPANATQQLAAKAFFSNGTTKVVTALTSWTTNNPAVADVTPTGLLVTKGPGTTTIFATSSGQSVAPVVGPMTITVNDATMVSIAVTPASKKIAKGLTQIYKATATFSDATTQVLVPPVVTWSSSLPSIVSVDATGKATAQAIGGPSTIRATSTSGVSGTATMTVTAATVATVVISPPTVSLPVGLTQQLTAQGTLTDGTFVDLTPTATWVSDTPGVASIAPGGLLTAVAAGNAIVTATDPKSKKTKTVTVTVRPAELQSIAVSLVGDAIYAGTDGHVSAIGTWTDGSTQDLFGLASWHSSNESVVTVDCCGGIHAYTAGTSTMTATLDGVSQSFDLTVRPGYLIAIAITPANPTVPMGTTSHLAAIGTFSDNSTADITSSVTWISSSEAIAVSNAPGTPGQVTAVAPGDSQVSATDPESSLSGSTTVTTGPAILVALEIIAPSTTMKAGHSQQLSAIGSMSDGSTANYTQVVTWSSSSASIVVVDNPTDKRGLAFGAHAGDASLTATDLGTGVSYHKTIVVEVSTNSSAAAEFSSFANPLGNFSYGWLDAVGGTFTQSTDHGIGGGGWLDYRYGVLPGDVHAARNTSDTTQQWGYASLPPGDLVLVPPSNGANSALSTCRWTAPQDGTYVVNATFQGNDPYCYVGATTYQTCAYNGCALTPPFVFINGGQSYTKVWTECYFGCYQVHRTMSCPAGANSCRLFFHRTYDFFGNATYYEYQTITWPGYGCVNGPTAAVYGVALDGVPLAVGPLAGSAAQTFNTSIHMSAGQTLDFTTGNNGTTAWDPIHFDATIATCVEAGLSECGSVCADTTSNTDHCGGCDNACSNAPNASPVCSASTCSTTCNDGFTDCDGNCIDAQADGNNCGTCGNICTTPDVNASASCSAGTCTSACLPGFDQCAGGCLDLQSDPNNCGVCDNVCSTSDPNALPTCFAAQCGQVCNAGYVDCNGTCIDELATCE